ncbi:HAMP domain-containing sensor histidine kinase [Microbispora sp. H11081]|uniref:HAMP domain-containing sensor histidine kinase n=1 Tax=Microbispora sp. H11081 TaxID=2729107 RepID=UPI00289BDE23|nr:HAMP domain-containing sensor histidine kinase [Microbispora sp. H11081]
MRIRLTVLGSAVMALLCAVAVLLVLIVLRGTAERYKTDELTTTAVRLAYQSKRDRLPPVLLDQDLAGVQVIDSGGRIVSASDSLVGRPRMAAFRPELTSPETSKELCHSPAFPGRCVNVVALRFREDDDLWTIYAADDVVPWHVSGPLLAALLGGSLLLVGLTAFGTYQTVRRALGPVEAITSKLARITATDLSQRVPVPKQHDEIRRLAETANQTLDRAETAIERQRRFASDASHDLRSPLTAMRTEIEEALLHSEDADWPATARALLGSCDRLQALVADLLQLARLDSGATPRREPADLGGLVARELDRRPRSVELERHLTPGVVVVGDRMALVRLLNNLLDNGERHAVSKITVTVRREEGKGVLEVLDDGAGILPDKRELVFQRFTRLDAARSKDAGGTGLGLSIARQIAQAHGGTLTIEDSDRGARFVLRLPLAPPR